MEIKSSCVKNVLYIMCDQVRFHYLSCYRRPHLETPHIDGLAAYQWYEGRTLLPLLKGSGPADWRE